MTKLWLSALVSVTWCRWNGIWASASVLLLWGCISVHLLASKAQREEERNKERSIGLWRIKQRQSRGSKWVKFQKYKQREGGAEKEMAGYRDATAASLHRNVPYTSWCDSSQIIKTHFLAGLLTPTCCEVGALLFLNVQPHQICLIFAKPCWEWPINLKDACYQYLKSVCVCVCGCYLSVTESFTSCSVLPCDISSSFSVPTVPVS